MHVSHKELFQLLGTQLTECGDIDLVLQLLKTSGFMKGEFLFVATQIHEAGLIVRLTYQDERATSRFCGTGQRLCEELKYVGASKKKRTRVRKHTRAKHRRPFPAPAARPAYLPRPFRSRLSWKKACDIAAVHAAFLSRYLQVRKTGQHEAAETLIRSFPDKVYVAFRGSVCSILIFSDRHPVRSRFRGSLKELREVLASTAT